MTKPTRDLPGLLQKADAVQHATAMPNEAAGKADTDPHLTTFIRLSLDDLGAAHRLQKAAAHLAPGWGTDVAAATILDETMALTGAGLGNVQLSEAATQQLRIVAHAGFGQEFLDHFEIVADVTSACGRAAAQHTQAVIPDVNSDQDYILHRDIAARSRFRAVQSTPLIDADGHLVGMVSTHFPQSGSPADRDLELTRLYGLLAGEALARSLPERAAAGLGGLRGDGPAWRAPASPLPRPVASLPGTTLPGATIRELTDTIVRSLLSAGLSLAGAQALIDDGVASDGVAAAIDELDQAIGGLRSVVLELPS
jgi:putative methionine-R-sulfoxide reductase with GAF domain